MPRKELLVPKMKQLPMHCVVASFGMVVNYLGWDVSQEQLAPRFGGSEKIIQKRGTSFSHVEAVGESMGLTVERYTSLTYGDIIEFIDEGHPIISLARGHIHPLARHVRVIRGYTYTPSLKTLLVNDPADLRISAWDWEDYSRLWRIQGKKALRNCGYILKP